VLPALPRNANGKTDRAALPAPVWQDTQTGGYAAPATPVEAVLAEIWQEVLGVRRVGVRDDFFRLGGHSLLGAQAMARVNATLAVELPIRVLFEAPTIAELAAALPGFEPEPGHLAAVLALRGEVADLSTDELRALLEE